MHTVCATPHKIQYDYKVIEKNTMDFDTIDTDMWNEIADMPGEIFDLSDEDREEMAKVFAMSEEEYYEYWNPEQFPQNNQ